MTLDSFGPNPVALVIGAGGGIGAALAAALRDAGAEVHALGRAELDITDAAAIAAVAERLPPLLDIVIVATGVLHDAAHRPERALAELDAGWLAHNFAVNAIGPALLAQALVPRLRRDRKSAFVALSARVGSIADNRLGGWHSYRASKAALNQLIRTIAIETARRNPAALVVALHPGTVETRLSAPFARSAPARVPPATAAAHLLAVLDRLTPAESGGLFGWDGAAIAY